MVIAGSVARACLTVAIVHDTYTSSAHVVDGRGGATLTVGARVASVTTARVAGAAVIARATATAGLAVAVVTKI